MQIFKSRTFYAMPCNASVERGPRNFCCDEAVFVVLLSGILLLSLCFHLGAAVRQCGFFAGVREDVGKQVGANRISLDSECEAQ